ncbi:hypothetical protein GCM10028856_02390 [Halopiger thermotolerans]
MTPDLRGRPIVIVRGSETRESRIADSLEAAAGRPVRAIAATRLADAFEPIDRSETGDGIGDGEGATMVSLATPTLTLTLTPIPTPTAAFAARRPSSSRRTIGRNCGPSSSASATP